MAADQAADSLPEEPVPVPALPEPFAPLDPDDDAEPSAPLVSLLAPDPFVDVEDDPPSLEPDAARESVR